MCFSTSNVLPNKHIETINGTDNLTTLFNNCSPRSPNNWEFRYIISDKTIDEVLNCKLTLFLKCYGIRIIR